MEILLFKNIIPFKLWPLSYIWCTLYRWKYCCPRTFFQLLPFPSNVRNYSPQTLALGIAHVLNFEHISCQSPYFSEEWTFFIFPQYNCSMFRALFPLACGLVSKSLSQNGCSLSFFIMRMISLLSPQLQIKSKC